MRIGEKVKYEQRSSLHDYSASTGYGIMGIDGEEYLPRELLDFCRTQYERYNIPVPPESVIRAGAWATYYTVDYVDPYSLLFGVSDVNVNGDWEKYTFELLDPDIRTGGSPFADPEWLETFSYVPGQSEASFNHYMSHPGIQNLPAFVTDYIELGLDGEWNGMDYLAQIGNEDELILREMCKGPDGTVNGEEVKRYFHWSAWAAWCWLIGPPGREFRYNHNDIFWSCFNGGECVIYDGFIIGPEQYRKIQRSPSSCDVEGCGLDSWCVELSQVGGKAIRVCEFHLNGNLPLYEGATCGTKACRHVECPYNSLHGQNGGLAAMYRKSGQLTHLARQGKPALPAPNIITLK